MGHSLVFFEKKNYLSAKYELVKEVCIVQVFFLTLLTVYQEVINHNHDVDWLDPQVCLTSSEVDGVDCHKNESQIYSKLHLHQ